MAVVGAGPAGLRAAEVAVAGGARAVLCDAQPSAGRKFLVAGRGGLNLTHSEPVENFPARYRAEPERWRDLLAEFGPNALRAWTEELAIKTYVGTSKRIFPRGQKAALLLRAWLQRLREAGIEFRRGKRLSSLRKKAIPGGLNLLTANPWLPAPWFWHSAVPPGRRPARTAPGRLCRRARSGDGALPCGKLRLECKLA